MKNKNIIEQLKSLRCSAQREGVKIRAYLYGTLPLEEVEAFEGHLDDCEKCCKIIFLKGYLKVEELEALTRPEQADGGSNGLAVAAAN
jgi:hypothetical protein